MKPLSISIMPQGKHGVWVIKKDKGKWVWPEPKGKQKKAGLTPPLSPSVF
jgi:hypothetical protein